MLYTHTLSNKGPGNGLGFFLLVLRTSETHWVGAELKSLKLWLFKPERKNPPFFIISVSPKPTERCTFSTLREEAHSPVISVLSITPHLKVEEVVSKHLPFAYKALKTHSQISVLSTSTPGIYLFPNNCKNITYNWHCLILEQCVIAPTCKGNSNLCIHEPVTKSTASSEVF